MLNIKSDAFKAAKINSLNIKKRSKKPQALELLKQEGKKSYKRRSIKNYNDRLVDAQKDIKEKMIIDYDKNNSNSIRCLSVKKIQK